MKQYLLDLLTQLATINSLADDLVYGKYVRIWNNQYQWVLDGKMEMFPYPAAFVEVIPADIQQLGDGSQMYRDMTVNIHILHWEMDAADNTMEQNLSVYNIAADAYLLMQEFVPTGASYAVSNLRRVSETPQYDHPGLYHFIQTYRVNLIDNTMQGPIGGIDSDPIPMPVEIDITKPDSTDANEPYIYGPRT